MVVEAEVVMRNAHIREFGRVIQCLVELDDSARAAELPSFLVLPRHPVPAAPPCRRRGCA